ncbi:unnamed protein product [Ranitomeya imitator]|uniref:ZP domain-containing protein n=1 Tax=Ranitomeya imitator TaxID=111125 RepID=A0ABN9LEI0_9NEOB|nr:unnamed protein product [Ranitomeya imitator]
MAASGTGSLVFIDDVTQDRSSRMNSEVFRAILCAQIQPNAAKLIGHRFILQMDNDPKHKAKATQEFIKAKKWNILEWPKIANSNAKIEINETVICTKDLIEVEIPSTFFLTKSPPIYISDLHLNDPECRGREGDDSYIFSIQTNFTDCGTIMVSDDSHIVFINTIHSNSSDVVTRSYINITFACRYPITYMVQQPNGESRISVDIRTITLSTEDGNFSVSMMLYKDEEFQDMWTTIPSLKLEDNIFVRVFMKMVYYHLKETWQLIDAPDPQASYIRHSLYDHSQIPGHLIIRLEKCWATPTNEPSHPVQYTFIQDSIGLGVGGSADRTAKEELKLKTCLQ